ncbi:MAG TPA: hypothetical protein VE034_07545 [Burkholderiales bacterium]|nr:hypothetical protein [Burkholderiales bacterium]
MTRALSACTALACALLAACVGPGWSPVESLGELGNDHAVIVGRVELVPPLGKDEQNFKNMIGSDMLRNKLLLITDEKWRRLNEAPERADYENRIEAPLEQTFFVRGDKKTFYVLIGELWLSAADKAYFPAGLKVDVRPTDRAVYVGTLRYRRNEFFQVTKREVIDDYERANAEFRKRFGSSQTLRKSLATPVKE